MIDDFGTLARVAERAADRQKYARYAYRAPVVAEKTHHVTVDLKTGERTVESVEPAVNQDVKRTRRAYVSLPSVLRLTGVYGGRAGGRPAPASMAEKAREAVRVFGEVFGVEVDDMIAPGNTRKPARPRQAVMFFMARRLKLSQPTIGRILARDHTTVTYTVNEKVPQLLAEDREFASLYHDAAQKLHAMWARPQ